MRRLLSLLLLLAIPAAAQLPEPERPAGLIAHGGPVRALAAGTAGAASGGLDQAVIVWTPQGRPLAVSRWHRSAVEALTQIPGGGWASGGEDGRIAIWPPAGAHEPDLVLEGHQGPVTALASDGQRLASGGFDATVRLWDGQGGVRIFEGHRGAITALAFTSEGLVSGGQDGTLRLWPEGTVKAEFGLPIAALAPLGGEALAIGTVDGTIRVLEGGQLRAFSTGPRPIVALTAHLDLLAAASIDGDVGIWDWRAGRLLRTLQGPGLPVWSAAFAPDGTLWTGGADRQVRRWDAQTGRPLSESPVLTTALPEGVDPHGARVWRACQACHALTPDAPPMAGPHLHRLFGRRMGSVPGYAYSERLARGDIIWTPETVADLFTRGPDVVTPGTRMPVQTVGNPEDMAALIRFLEVATR
ncbi:MAG: hypothetical protein RMK64_05740 [Rhodovarius sp.]|nr:hypothetical protein [Rhodovarius sp.]